jgi:hypothetical protein
MVKPPLRTKTLGTKLSEPEYAQLEAAARERGLTLSEWCRQVLLASVNGQGSKSAADPTGSDQALMAELVALRTILLNLHFRIAKGEPITAEAMQEIIDRADAGKVRNARERLEQAAKKNPAEGRDFPLAGGSICKQGVPSGKAVSMWGRTQYRGWPTRWQVSSLGALLIAVVAGIGIFTIQNGVMWTPLQRWYWGQYLNTEVFPTRATSPWRVSHP